MLSLICITTLEQQRYQSGATNPTFRTHLESFFMLFQLLTGEGAQDIKNNAVFSEHVAVAVIEHALFLGFNYAISIIVVDLVVATFLEYKGASTLWHRG